MNNVIKLRIVWLPGKGTVPYFTGRGSLFYYLQARCFLHSFGA